MSPYICLSARSNNIPACDDDTYIHHVMLTFPTSISFCCVFWIACQRSGATKFLPHRYAIQPAHKPVVIPNSLPPGSTFSLQRITVELAVPMRGLPPHQAARKALEGIHRPRNWLQTLWRLLNGRWTKRQRMLSKWKGISHRC